MIDNINNKLKQSANTNNEDLSAINIEIEVLKKRLTILGKTAKTLSTIQNKI